MRPFPWRFRSKSTDMAGDCTILAGAVLFGRSSIFPEFNKEKGRLAEETL
jgi:hypothetical protein